MFKLPLPRRVAYVASSRIPSRAANTVHVINMSAALVEVGADVTLFARGEMTDRRAQLSEFGIERDFEVSLLPLRRPVLLDRLSYLRHLRNGLKSGGFDFAYGRSSYALLGGVPAEIPFAYDLHVFAADFVQRRVEATLFKRRNFLFATAITRALAEKYVDTYPHLEGRIVVAPCAAAPKRFSDEAVRGEARQSISVYYVGHLYEGRGIDLILALAALEPEIEFHIVGGEDSDVNRWSLQATANVTFHGYVKPSELARHYAAADVCIAPHQHRVLGAGGGDITSWMSPMKLFEYMSYGKPIIAANLPVIREVLSDSETALLCDPEDVGAWRSAIRQLRFEPQLRQRLGTAALAQFSENYTWSKRALTVLNRAAIDLIDNPAKTRA